MGDNCSGAGGEEFLAGKELLTPLLLNPVCDGETAYVHIIAVRKFS